MKAMTRILVALALLSPAAYAVKVPLPIEGATMNVQFQLQFQTILTENGTPDGQNLNTDMFIRRSRLLVNGDVNPNHSYLIQFDNPNFGKRGDYTARALIQDAWFGWAPTGTTGGTVVSIDAGILLLPISRHLLTTTTQYITADNHSDSFRGITNTSAFRDVGIQVRGWALNKKVGFRGGLYEGQRGAITPAVAATPTIPAKPASADAINQYGKPRLGGFINFDLIGSEEGGWLYKDMSWGKDPIVSIGLGTIYQSLATKGPNGYTDQMVNSVDLFADIPMGGDAEAVFQGTVYNNKNGSGSANSGLGMFVDVGYRFGAIKPYAGFEYFNAYDCPDDQIANLPASCSAVGTTNSRNLRAGLDFYFNKNLNHVNLEFSLNRGQSAYGPQSLATVGSSTRLDRTAQKALLLHWNAVF